MSRRLRPLAFVVPALVLLAGCGDDASSGARGDRVLVAATTTQVADLAREVGGDRAEVRGLLPANADPHDYEVRPRDLDALASAKVVLRSGGDLDAWLDSAIEGSGSEGEVVRLIDSVQTRTSAADDHAEDKGHEAEAEAVEHAEGAEGGELDPHWWQDPRNAVRAVARIRDALVAVDPEGAADYRANAAAYERRLRSLDRAVAACLARVPEARRKLVTTHDALGYYAARYDIEVIGTVIPSLSTRGQPSVGETAALVDTIRRERVGAIFAESSVSAKVERAVARESGARIGKALYADSLGPAGSAGDTYVKSIEANTRALLEGFTGSSRGCALPAA